MLIVGPETALLEEVQAAVGRFGFTGGLSRNRSSWPLGSKAGPESNVFAAAVVRSGLITVYDELNRQLENLSTGMGVAWWPPDLFQYAGTEYDVEYIFIRRPRFTVGDIWPHGLPGNGGQE